MFGSKESRFSHDETINLYRQTGSLRWLEITSDTVKRPHFTSSKE